MYNGGNIVYNGCNTMYNCGRVITNYSKKKYKDFELNAQKIVEVD